MATVTGKLINSTGLDRYIVFLPDDATSPCDTRYQGSTPVQVSPNQQFTVSALADYRTYQVAITNLQSVGSGNKKCDWARLDDGTDPATVTTPSSGVINFNEPWDNPIQGPAVTGTLSGANVYPRKVVLLPADATSPCDTRAQGSSPVQVASDTDPFLITGLSPSTTYKVATTNLLSGSSKKCAFANPSTVTTSATCDVVTQNLQEDWDSPTNCS